MSADGNPPRRRISFSLGTWQLVVLLACLDQADAEHGRPEEDHLVLYGPDLPERMRQAMDALAGTRTWTSVIWADELLRKPASPSGGDCGAVDGLRGRLDRRSADEIWLCKLFDFPEKVAAEAFPTARIQLYEDGMHFYVPQPTIHGAMHDWAEVRRSCSRRAARWVLGRGDAWWSPGVWASHTARVAGCWAVLPASAGLQLPPALRRGVDPDRVRQHLAAMAVLAGTTGELTDGVDGSRRPLAIVLGQAYARFDLVTAERELEIYSGVCRALLEDGFVVLWKDHPRLEVGYGPQLYAELDRVGPIRPLNIGSEWPVEAVVAELQPSVLASATSTSLFLCAALFGTSCYSFADELHISRLRRDHHWMAQLAIDTFPPIGDAAQTFESSIRLGVGT